MHLHILVNDVRLLEKAGYDKQLPSLSLATVNWTFTLQTCLELTVKEYFKNADVSRWSYLGFLETVKPLCISCSGSNADCDSMWWRKFKDCLNHLIEEEKHCQQNDISKE
ncbi:hypothetical protein BC938DRAFT_480210 [Jimgerdemannia flammicorona]|uniref:Uncharacterized protein n=1 Tax=Jimgerdemannia flammicorona TaxID=994334 RepID=A0A433QJ38_9FUNG|nr:hypothetical protein BC938DRAFT_480210 [Jimgerdemannia flammicorona]